MFHRALLLSWALTSAQTSNYFVDGQLIRPVPVYQKIIEGIHDYFNNTCIILLHATRNPIISQGISEGMALHKLQTYLSGRYIRTALMDLTTFTSRVGLSYFHIKRPLFVLLNDSEDVKRDFGEVTGWIDMSYPTWLIFFRDETRINDFFANIYVPFDCTLMIAQRDKNESREIIREVYQIDRDEEMREGIFGSWDSFDGITTPRLALYQRRNNLFGKIIRAASIHDPPGSLIVRNDDGIIIGLGGFFGGIMELLEESMNCTIKYIESETWGYYNGDNGTWTGAIGMLTEGVADIVAAEVMMTGERLEAIDFTTPLYTTKCRTFIKRPLSSSVKWNVYIAPFHSGIWSSIAFLILVTSATISLVKSIVPIVSVTKMMKDIDQSPSNFIDILLAVFGSFCSQGMDSSLLDPIRIIHLVIHVTGVVVLAAYSAALISSLAVKTFVMPFTTMEGLLQDGTYRFGVVGGSADYSFFKNTSDKVLRVLFDDVLTKELQLPNNYYDGLQKVCQQENYAFMTLDNVVSQLQPRVNCKLEPLDTIMQSSIAMAVRPQSPYRGIINANILLIRDSGILQRLLNAEWILTANKLESGWTTVEITDVLPLVIVIIFGIFFSFITFASEYLAFNNKLPVLRNKKMSRKNNRLRMIKLKMHNNRLGIDLSNV